MTSFQRNRFFDQQLMPRWNHHGHGGAVRFDHWLPTSIAKPARISQQAWRESRAALTAKCQQCGTVFKVNGRQKAKTCSRPCHVKAMQLGGRQRIQPQSSCAPCLYRVGFGVKRIAKLARVSPSTARMAVKRAGLQLDHGRSQAIVARLHHEAHRPKREAKARLIDDLRLLRTVIGEMRRDLQSKSKADPSTPEQIEKARRASRDYYHANKVQVAELIRLKERNNPSVRMRRRLRRRMWFLITTAGQKKRRSNILVGCSDLHLKAWLAAKFKRGMTWKNYGQWEVDHIVPCSSFDMANNEEQSKCFHYTNLQPLWKRDNRIKHNTMPNNHQPEFAISLCPPAH